jgi:heterodisulfide reductase subunit A
MNRQVVVIGGGVAGLTVSATLADLGAKVTLIEKNPETGGHVRNWDRLFPSGRPASEVIEFLNNQAVGKVDIRLQTTVTDIRSDDGIFEVTLSGEQKIMAENIVFASGFEIFEAEKKEEYGYGIYNNVITSAGLEKIFKLQMPLQKKDGSPLQRVAFIHCVGSRDEKVGNRYCSKVCCITGLKQAMEIRQMLPGCEVYCFYMDLRMFDRHFEELYLEAQQQWGVNFIRGRLSECAENTDHSVVIKTEDTLTGKPLKMSVDMVVLLAGFCPNPDLNPIFDSLGLKTGEDGFIKVGDGHLKPNVTEIPGIFLTGAVKGPVSISETIADAKAAGMEVWRYINRKT